MLVLVPVTSATFPLSLISALRRFWSTRRRRKETFRGIEDPGVDKLGLRRLAPKFGQRAREAHPVENLLLTARLDRRRWIVSPRVIVARTQRLEERTIRGCVRVEVMVLLNQKRMRPSRRRQQRDAPRTGGKDARRGGAEIEQAPRRGRGRVELRRRGRVFEHRQTAALCDHLAAVAIDREGNYRVRKPGAIVIKVHDAVRERVTQRMMQRLIGIGGIESRFD